MLYRCLLITVLHAWTAEGICPDLTEMTGASPELAAVAVGLFTRSHVFHPHFQTIGFGLGSRPARSMIHQVECLYLEGTLGSSRPFNCLLFGWIFCLPSRRNKKHSSRSEAVYVEPKEAEFHFLYEVTKGRSSSSVESYVLKALIFHIGSLKTQFTAQQHKSKVNLAQCNSFKCQVLSFRFLLKQTSTKRSRFPLRRSCEGRGCFQSPSKNNTQTFWIIQSSFSFLSSCRCVYLLFRIPAFAAVVSS